MAPSKSPETRPQSVAPTPRADPEPLGMKRKAEEELRPSASAGPSHKPDERSLSRGQTVHTLPQTSQAAQTSQQPTPTAPPGQVPPGSQPPNRYSIYGPTNRDSILAGSPWSALSHRYQTMTAARRDPSPANPSPAPSAASLTPAVKTAAPTAAHIDPPRRPSPDPVNARDRFYPSAMAGYPHYNMGRRELQEHREQLREGKRWLDGMLSRTEKLLSMVENKMTVANNETMSSTSMPGRKDELDYEERERVRQREMRRIEEEREKDRQEREKRDRERAAGMATFGGLFGRDRPFLGMGHMSQPPAQASSAPKTAAAIEREKSEAERNRDLLLASRKVSAISPAEREREKEKERAKEAEEKKTGWNGEPVLGGTALPRRDQGLGRGFGRGLWSFA